MLYYLWNKWQRPNMYSFNGFMNVLKRVIGKLLHFFLKCFSSIYANRGEVLMIHWVCNDRLDNPNEKFRLSTEQFESLIDWLKVKNVIRLENWESESDFYALTVDDVPECFYFNAYPILVKEKIPFTLFVNVSLLDTVGYITSEQLKEMSSNTLCTIGSHGIEHVEYARLSCAEVLNELHNSKDILERKVGKSVQMFAFPYGSYYACGYKNKVLAGEIYKYAFGTVASPITQPTFFKQYFLPRINVDADFIKSMQ